MHHLAAPHNLNCIQSFQFTAKKCSSATAQLGLQFMPNKFSTNCQGYPVFPSLPLMFPLRAPNFPPSSAIPRATDMQKFLLILCLCS